MTMRVALLAAECEPWAKTGGLADVVDALARALGRCPRPASSEAGRDPAPVDVFLPRYRGVPVPPTRCRPSRRCGSPDPRPAARPSRSRIVDVAADGYRLRLVDYPAAFDRDGYYDHAATTRGASPCFCRAALAALRRDGRAARRPPCPRLAHRARPARACPRRLRRRPVPPRARGDCHAPQPRLPRLDAARAARPARASPGDRSPARPGRPRPPADGDRAAPSSSTRSRPGFAARGADARVRHGPRRRRCARRATGSSGSSTASTPASGIRRRTRRSRRRTGAAPPAGKAACGRTCSRESASTRPTTAPVLGMIGRLDPQKGFDLLAGGRRRCSRRRAGHRPGQRPRVARRSVPGARGVRTRPGRAGRAVRPRHGPADLRRRRPVPDAVAVRAVRPGPDDRAALRDAAGRPADRRPRRQRRSTWTSSRGGTGFVFDEADAGGTGRGRAGAPIASRRRRRARWAALLDRGMAVDFGWGSGSAPRYLEAVPAGGRAARGCARRSRAAAIAPAPRRDRRAPAGQIAPSSRTSRGSRRPEDPMPRQFVVQVTNQPGQMAPARRAAGGARRRPARDRRRRPRRGRHMIMTTADDDAARAVLEEGGWTFLEGESVLAEVDDRPAAWPARARAADAGVNMLRPPVPRPLERPGDVRVRGRRPGEGAADPRAPLGPRKPIVHRRLHDARRDHRSPGLDRRVRRGRPCAAWARTVAMAHEAEGLGFDSVWMSTTSRRSRCPRTRHVRSLRRAVRPGGQTARVRLGHLVLCASYRNPALVAKMISTLDVVLGWARRARARCRLEGGRVRRLRLRVSAGRHAARGCSSTRSRSRAGCWRRVGPRGTAVWARVVDAVNVPRGLQEPRIPILVGGNGPNRTWRLAGAFRGRAEPRLVLAPAGGRGAAGDRLPVHRVGRDPRSLRLSVNIGRDQSVAGRRRRGWTCSVATPTPAWTGS